MKEEATVWRRGDLATWKGRYCKVEVDSGVCGLTTVQFDESIISSEVKTVELEKPR